jgi:hypothetical protein
MKVHIIGAGPTGMSIAWELSKLKQHDITIYDRKPSAGGSWWEPNLEERDLHAHRIVFDNAFINTRTLFKEMDIQWDDVFEKVNGDVYSFLFKQFSLKDYQVLASLATRVILNPSKYKSISLKNALGKLSKNGEAVLSHITLIIDGVTWDVMSAYEFIRSFDHVGLSSQYTQKISGKYMCDKMQKALMNVGVKFQFDNHLSDIKYLENEYSATFENGTRIVNDGLLLLCVDNSKALHLIKDNWGEDANKKIRYSTYGCINILLDYEKEITLDDDLKIAMKTRWNLQPVVLSDKKTISCVICDLTDEILKTNPDDLVKGIINQLNISQPKNTRIAWGCHWNGTSWEFEQSSGVLSLTGQVPFWGKSHNVALCGMMSPRNTPYSSLEAAIEVGKRFTHENFGTEPPLETLLITHVILLLIVLMFIFI